MTQHVPFSALTPPSANANDGSPYTMGTEFYVTQSGCTLLGIRVWCPIGALGSRTGRLYAVGGALVGVATPAVSAVENAYINLVFGTPIALTSGTKYFATALIPSAGQYSATSQFFNTGAGGSNHITGPVVVPSAANKAAASPGQGSFRASGAAGIPNGTFNNAMYWIVPVVEDNQPATGLFVKVGGVLKPVSSSSIKLSGVLKAGNVARKA